MANEKILVVDDDDSIRMACIAALKTEGYIVVSATSGETAVNLIKQNKYDLVLTDYQMGEINGMDVAKEVKRINPDCEVIMMTAFAKQSLAKELLTDVHGASFLCKPIDVMKLRVTIKSCFERKITKQRLEETKKLSQELLSRKTDESAEKK